ncbi:MAG: M20/M25/M40 family metallo-hydrolase [Leptolyngbyaceae cyanobacterium MO_188.B28]|nr:M20/M25/M40 family metallo-hydrolase [Leptolyngbyaceae cyanobacterium MO_188.B28]
MRQLATVSLAVLVLGSAMRQAQPVALDERERAMITWIDEQAEAPIGLLEQLVNINSGTMNPEGVRDVGAVLRSELDRLGFETEWVELPPEMERAGHLIGRRSGERGAKILLIGHMDTVFEADDSFQAFSRDGNVGRGPGVVDMKSGNVVILYALRAMQAAGVLDGVQLQVFYTGDEEEPGRPLSISRKELIEAGKWADVALGFEAAVHSDGTDWATVARRSAAAWRLEVKGRQAHSSRVFSEDVGAGAIFEAARIVTAFYEDVRGEEYLTFSAGAIAGGSSVEYDFAANRGSVFGKPNVVPNTAVVHGDIRAISREQLERAQEAMLTIVSHSLPHTESTLTFYEGYPPMAPTEGNLRLQDQLSAINQALGRGPMPALDPMRRGAADISFVAPYSAALAGLGAIGKGAHTPDESVELDSMPLAIKRAAILMYRLSQPESKSDSL